VSWPGGEFGAMGIEGAVRLSLRKQLEALPDEASREQLVQQAVAYQSERGKAISMASYLEIDAVIDPADTRAWILRGLQSCPVPTPRERRFLDTW
jgi:acetyl-CoA carboxylase carboxyltransferase component